MKKISWEIILLIFIVIILLKNHNKQGNVSMTYNYYDANGNLITMDRQSIVNGTTGVAFIAVNTTVRNTGDVPLTSVGISGSYPPALRAAYLSTPQVPSLAPGASATFISDLINVTQFEGQLVDLSVTLTGNYITGEGSTSDITYTGTARLDIKPEGIPITGTTYYVSMSTGNDANNGLSPSTPFKTIPFAVSKLASNDKLYVMNDTYRLSSTLDLSAKKNITITGYNSKPTILNSIQEYEISNSKWSVYDASKNIYSTSITTSSPTLTVYDKNTLKQFFIYTSYNALYNSTFEEGAYFSSNTLYLKSPISPNSRQLYISKADTIKISSGDNIELSNLHIFAGTKGIYITSSNNILLRNLTIINGLKSIDIRTSRNIRIQSNVLQYYRGSWSWSHIKGSTMETSAMWLNNNYEGFEISNNEIIGNFNGILLYTTSTGMFRDIIVRDNMLHNIFDDAIEIEDYCNGGNFYNNNIYDSFVAISLSPADATEKACNIYGNNLDATKSIWFVGTTYYTGECFKIIPASAATNIIRTNNNCIGRYEYNG